MRATVGIATDAPAAGRHRVDPGSIVNVTFVVDLVDAARGARLVAALPLGWVVVDDGGASVDPATGSATWALGDRAAGAGAQVVVALRAPLVSPSGDPAFTTALEARLEHSGGTAATAATSLFVAPAIVVEHTVLARVAAVTYTTTYLSPDADLDGLARFGAFRVRFQVRNADLLDVALTPRLQLAKVGEERFVDVPVGGSEDGDPFYLDAEWRPTGNGDGTLPGPAEEAIPVDALRVGDTDGPGQDPVAGRRFMDQERDVRVVLPADSYTEIEFAVRVSRDIAPDEEYRLRLTDAGRAIDGAVVAGVGTGLRISYPLTPGQHEGIPVGPPVDAPPVAVSEVDFPLVTPDVLGAAWHQESGTLRYRLAIAVPLEPEVGAPPSAPYTSPHTPDSSLASDTCAACHRTHVARNSNLLAEAAPQAALCFTCHDGIGSNLATTAQYSDPAVPANDPATRSYYRHDAVAVPVTPDTHSMAQDDEFGGLSNRHSECADCHNPHNATVDVSTQTTTGWTVAGQQRAVSGVSVANGAAGTAPVYAFLDGTAGLQPTREYEVCLKCHSGFTTLRSNAGQPASRQVLDKGVELNPSNASYHPVEAPGTNATPQMAWSLANTSPYKMWNFTTGGTVRCVNCHGDPRKFDATTPPDAGSDLAPHTSQYRGILIQGYRDRVLKSPDEAYDAVDFALCYVCHAEQPFRSSTPTNTVFDDHDLHVSSNAGEGSSGTDIDTPGDGGGNALCAECHFRNHSTAEAYNAGDRSNSRLVNFSPNVEPNNGVLQFTKSATGGSCTLVCHGEVHDNEGY